MAIQREITVKLANSPGTLSRVSQLLGGERINILAMSVDPSGHLRLVVDNPLHAASMLREQHYNVEERDVLYTAMPNEPGSLSRALRLLGEAGIAVTFEDVLVPLPGEARPARVGVAVITPGS